jgi:hypothetical protein
MMMKKLAALAGVAVAASAATAGATTVNDTTLASPPGVYFGSGNINSHFSVTTENGIEIGQQALERFVGPVTPTGNLYTVDVGATTVPGKTGSWWGFVFSVNLGSTGLHLGDVTATLTMTDAVNGTTTATPFNLQLIPDNAGYDGSAFHTAVPTDIAFQNSEALSFATLAGFLGDPAYDINANNTYTFTLDVDRIVCPVSFTACDLNLAQNTIVVQAGTGAPAPEPLSIAMFGAGLVGMGFARRKRAG